MTGTITIAIVGMLLLGFAVATVFRPVYALAAVLCMFMLEQFAESGSTWFLQHNKVINFCVGLIVLEAVLFRTLRGQLAPRQLSSTYLFAVVLFLWAALSYVWSMHPEYTSSMIRFQSPYVVLAVFVAPLLITDLKEARQFLVVTGYVSFGVLLVMLLGREWSERGLVYPGSFYSRIDGERISESKPLALASAAGRAAVIAILLPLGHRKISLVWLRWVAAGVAIFVLFKTQSRGQVIAAVVVLALFIPLLEGLRNWKSTATLVFALLALAGLIAYGFVSVESGRWDSGRLSDAWGGTRVIFIQNVMSAWIGAGPVYWILGIGNSASFGAEINGIYPHFVALEVIAEEGLIGLALFVGIYYTASRSTRILWRATAPGSDERRTLAVLTGLALFDFLISCKQGAMMTSYYMFFDVIIIARIATMLQASRYTLRATGGTSLDYRSAGATPGY